MRIEEVFNKEEKAAICLRILHALPDWFAVEASVQEYAAQAREQSFFAAFDGEQPIGFCSVKFHNAYTAEICVMGVLEDCHRRGTGMKLIQAAEAVCREKGVQFLTVKTLDSSAHYEPYEHTRSFYRKAGFLPLEVFTTLWDADNPCLFLAKFIGGSH